MVACWAYDSSMLNFWRKCQIYFQRGCIGRQDTPRSVQSFSALLPLTTPISLFEVILQDIESYNLSLDSNLRSKTQGLSFHGPQTMCLLHGHHAHPDTCHILELFFYFVLYWASKNSISCPIWDSKNSVSIFRWIQVWTIKIIYTYFSQYFSSIFLMFHFKEQKF